MLNWLLGLFSSGKIPEYARNSLEQERIALLEEELTLTVTYRGYRAPGKYFGWKRRWCRGSLAVTEQRVIAFAWNAKQIDVPFDHPAFNTLLFSIEQPETLCIETDAAHFQTDTTGTIEYRFRTRSAQQFLSQVQAHQKPRNIYA